MQIVAKVILCINSFPNLVSRHPIGLDRMLTHVVMGCEPKTEVLFTCGPMDQLGMPYLVINYHVEHQLHHHVHMGLV